MLYFALILVALETLFWVDSVDGSPVAPALVRPVAVDGSDSHISGQLNTHPIHALKTNVRVTNGAADTVTLLVKGTIILGILFLVVRCAAQISASRSSKTRRRRLADINQCGKEVSKTPVFYHAQ